MSKIFLCGITQNSLADIDEMTKDVYQYFDGLIFAEHRSTDGTRELLESRKGGGEIVTIPFLNDHSWSMNSFLASTKLQHGDFFILRDTKERLNVEFCKNIRSFANELAANNIALVYQYSKLLMAKYYLGSFFQGTPHWGYRTQVAEGEKFMKIEEYFRDESCAFSIRNRDRKPETSIAHYLRYYLYKNSNHLLLGRENNIQEYQVHEDIRRKFLRYLSENLKIELTVDALKNYIIKNGLNYELKWFFNWEEILNTWYCYEILGHKFEDVNNRRENKILYRIE